MKAGLRRHGASHSINGSDPIKDGIFFNVDNVGGYLEIDADDANASTIGGSTSAWNIAMRGHFVGIGATGAFAVLLLDSADEWRGHGDVVYLVSETDLNLTAGNDLNIAVDNYMTATLSGGGEIDSSDDLFITTNNGGGGNLFIVMGTGKKVEIQDHLGNPKIRWTEGTNDLHMPTSGTIVADL